VGEASLVNQELAYKLQVGLVETSKGQEGLDLADLKGVVIPVNVHGAFKALKVEPNLQVFLTNAAKQKLGELLHTTPVDKPSAPTPQDKLWNDWVQPLKNINFGSF
jgi:hypothetical protein